MKKIIFTLILSVIGILTNAQSISIELSIEWKDRHSSRKMDSLIDSSIVKIPYLRVSYKNYTNESIYFVKPIRGIGDFPNIIWSSFLGDPYGEKYKIEFGKGSNEMYKIVFRNYEHYHYLWEILADTIELDEDHTLNKINDEICKIYSLLKETGSSISFKVDNYNEYKKDDIIPENISTKFNKNFIFLKENEVLSEEFNLIGFYVYGGEFNFFISEKELPDYVLGDLFRSEKEKKWCYKKINLPKKVDGYKLYYGEFKSNTVVLEIK